MLDVEDRTRSEDSTGRPAGAGSPANSWVPHDIEPRDAWFPLSADCGELIGLRRELL